MELNEPLNQAHRTHRKAERLLRNGDCKEAIATFEQAAREFEFAEQTCTCDYSGVIEALRVQQSECLRQVARIRIDLCQLEARQRVMAGMLSNLSVDEESSDFRCVSAARMRDTIFEHMRITDDLINHLNDDDQLSNVEARGNKRPKDEKTVVEELKMCNVELKRLVRKLLEDLDAKMEEIDRLNKRIVDLEICPHCGVCRTDTVTPHGSDLDLPPLDKP